MTLGSKITGLGSAHPPTVMTNVEFEKFLDTSDEWISSRTGIKERRIADPKKGESTLSLCVEASKVALERAGVNPANLDAILVGTVTPETVMPTTAVQLQAKLGMHQGFAFDFQAACSGFLYGLLLVDHLVRAGTVKTALVLGAETLSTIVNWRDRDTCILFGDGAGAAVIQQTQDEHRIVATQVYSDGRHGSLLKIPHGYSKVPPYHPDYRNDQHKIIMKGRDVFKHAVRNMVESSQNILADNGIGLKDVDFFIFHQANLRIIETCLSRLGVGLDKTWINLDKYGNTSAATLPTCLDEAVQAGKVKSGDLVLLTTFGGGLTWASSLVRM